VIEQGALVPASVLVPLVVAESGEPGVIFTRRPETLSHHAGQVSFPGGRLETSDATPLAAALRETEEELGIPTASVEPLGALDDVWVITGFRITPFVGRVEPGVELRPSAAEVARVFTVPLRELVDPDRTKVRVERLVREGNEIDVPYFEHGGEVIWGATGRALLNLLEVALDYVHPPPILKPL
jgi:8-oxo-dGTP pyrophosphatase MutT (NUDIX family)